VPGRPISRRRAPVYAAGCAALALGAASQWYLYDAVHGQAERAAYYILTCGYLCGVLVPFVLWLGEKKPLEGPAWRRNLALHIGASAALTAIGVFAEAAVGWLPHSNRWAFGAAVGHYFKQHTQIGLLTYWTLLGCFHLYRAHERARMRRLHTIELEKQLAASQLSALRAQLQPHFLFNTLQAAVTLVYDDPPGAEEILHSLSELLRASIDTLDRNEQPLRREIDLIRHYAAIQQRRFGDRLQIQFHVDEAAQPCAVPCLLLQPLVENAVRHGIGLHPGAPDVVTVHAALEGDRLEIAIRNRAGVLNGPLEHLLSRGVGLANTISRLECLYGGDYTFRIGAIPPRGVAVSLAIPARNAGLIGRRQDQEVA